MRSADSIRLGRQPATFIQFVNIVGPRVSVTPTTGRIPGFACVVVPLIQVGIDIKAFDRYARLFKRELQVGRAGVEQAAGLRIFGSNDNGEFIIFHSYVDQHAAQFRRIEMQPGGRMLRARSDSHGADQGVEIAGRSARGLPLRLCRGRRMALRGTRFGRAAGRVRSALARLRAVRLGAGERTCVAGCTGGSEQAANLLGDVSILGAQVTDVRA